MIEIKDLLGKFARILHSSNAEIESIQEILYRVVGIEIKKEDIQIKNNVLYLNIKPIYKNEIFLRKEKIASLLEEALGKRFPKTIR